MSIVEKAHATLEGLDNLRHSEPVSPEQQEALNEFAYGISGKYSKPHSTEEKFRQLQEAPGQRSEKPKPVAPAIRARQGPTLQQAPVALWEQPIQQNRPTAAPQMQQPELTTPEIDMSIVGRDDWSKVLGSPEPDASVAWARSRDQLQDGAFCGARRPRRRGVATMLGSSGRWCITPSKDGHAHKVVLYL